MTLWYSLRELEHAWPGPNKFVGFPEYSLVFSDPTFRAAALEHRRDDSVGGDPLDAPRNVARDPDQPQVRRPRDRSHDAHHPFLVMPVATALLFKTTIYDPIFGLLDLFLSPFGVHHVNWIGTYAVPSVVLVLVWEWTPFMMLIVLAGLQSERLEAIEAARVDGANAFQTFVWITFPHLRRYIELGAAARLDLHRPGLRRDLHPHPGRRRERHATTNLPYYIYELAFNSFNVSEAAAARRDRRDRHRDHRDLRAARARQPVQGRRGDGLNGTGFDRRYRHKRAAASVGRPRPGRRSPGSRRIMFFPVLWMVLTAFKQEGKAYTDPPTFVFHPTLSEFSQGLLRRDRPALRALAVRHAVSRSLVLVLAIPAAYALSIRAVKRWRDVLFFFLDQDAPYVAAIVPIYIVALHLGLLDNDWALVILYTAFNLPLAVWMIRSFLLEIPKEMLEAARIDGAGPGPSSRA